MSMTTNGSPRKNSKGNIRSPQEIQGKKRYRSSMSPKCDNFRDAHDPVVINEDDSAMLVWCKVCGHEMRIGKDIRGIYDNVQFSEAFPRLTMQANNALLYKYYPQYLKS